MDLSSWSKSFAPSSLYTSAPSSGWVSASACHRFNWPDSYMASDRRWWVFSTSHVHLGSALTIQCLAYTDQESDLWDPSESSNHQLHATYSKISETSSVFLYLSSPFRSWRCSKYYFLFVELFLQNWAVRTYVCISWHQSSWTCSIEKICCKE